MLNFKKKELNSGKRKLDTTLFYDFQDQSERDGIFVFLDKYYIKLYFIHIFFSCK